jgi:hypothetical protein
MSSRTKERFYLLVTIITLITTAGLYADQFSFISFN